MIEGAKRQKGKKGHRTHQTMGEAELEITAVAVGGEGIGRLQLNNRSRVVLVPRAALGDVVCVDVQMQGGAPRGRILKVVKPSNDRIEPFCPHVERCGGCDFMHLTGDAQRRAWTMMVRESLRGLIESDTPMPMHLTTQREGYRSRIRLGVLAGADQVRIGFRTARTNRIVEVDRCVVASPVVEFAQGMARRWLANARGTGELTIERVSAELAALSLRWSGTLPGTVFAQAERWVDEGAWAGVEIWLDGAKEPACIGKPGGMTVGVDGVVFRTAPGGFMQAHDEMSQRLVTRVVTHAIREAHTVELFCGAGNMTVELGRHVERLMAVESDGRAVEAARWNLAARGLNVRVVQADANSVEIPRDARVVVLDPPRAGASEACGRIAQSRAKRVVMISCDPATLGRDAGLLVQHGGFRVGKVELFEMFPHTHHVETMAVLERA